MVVCFKKMMIFNLMMMLNFRKPSTSKSLPPRPPPAKTGPGRPPPPNLQATGRSQSRSKDASPKPKTQKPHRKGPVLPPRPNPGHRLYNKYTVRDPTANLCAVTICQTPHHEHLFNFCFLPSASTSPWYQCL